MNIKLRSKMYEKFVYPDKCSMQVRIKPEYIHLFKKDDNVITARCHSFEDLIETNLLANAVSEISEGGISIILPYLPFSRADRRFVEGDCFGLDVMVDLFVSANPANTVYSYDLHSSKAEYYNFENISPKQEIEQAIFDFTRYHGHHTMTVLFPDKGAYHRYGGMIEDQYGNNHATLTVRKAFAKKKRNPETGKFEGFNVPDVYGPTLIVDDICDGGGTFIGIAEQLGLSKSGLPKPFGLYTSHGIYSKGLDELTRYYDKLYCVDTFYTKEEYFNHYCGYMNSGQLTVIERFF